MSERDPVNVALRAASRAAASRPGEPIDVLDLQALAEGRLPASRRNALEAQLVHDDDARALLVELRAEVVVQRRRRLAWGAGAAGGALAAAAALVLVVTRAAPALDYAEPRVRGGVAELRGEIAETSSVTPVFAPDGVLEVLVEPRVPLDGRELYAAAWTERSGRWVRLGGQLEIGPTGVVRWRTPVASIPRDSAEVTLHLAVARRPLDDVAGRAPPASLRSIGATWRTISIHVHPQEPHP
jgi:hypothetical protein